MRATLRKTQVGEKKKMKFEAPYGEKKKRKEKTDRQPYLAIR